MSFNPVVCALVSISFFMFNTNFVNDNIIIILWLDCGYCGRYSDLLRDGWCRDRIPDGLRFIAPMQTSPRSHPALFIIATLSLSQR